ncbi:MAG: diacylglycerol kinase family protein [candidate division Zixibacteria bacterium]|nr:diacylglycerol kinase family protein [candidate division Zixibacteria bacterium]
MRKKYQKGPRPHFLIMVNRKAANFNERSVDQLTKAIHNFGGFYTIENPKSADELLRQTQLACGLKHRHRRLPAYMTRRGKVTSLVAAGGDGTVNLVARVALAAELPMGILPLGKNNDIARALYPSLNLKHSINAITKRKFRHIDTMTVDGQLVVGSMSVGLLVNLQKELDSNSWPRFSFRRATLGAKIADDTKAQRVTLKLDSFRFDVQPTILNVNLLPYTLGLNLSPTSLFDDQQAEIVFDVGCSNQILGDYIRQIYKGNYLYGSEIRLFSGSSIHLSLIGKQKVLIDGERVRLSIDKMIMKIGEKQLKVFS